MTRFWSPTAQWAGRTPGTTKKPSCQPRRTAATSAPEQTIPSRPAVRRRWHDGFFVVPGVRPVEGAVGDQKRVITPRAAIDAGASILVIGRPVTAAEDPDAALRAIAATL